MRASTVCAAWAPSGSAAWQLIRSGRPDGAAASPAATMRGSSTLVSVSSVSSRPSASVVRPLAAARSGTPKPAVHTVTALGSVRPSAAPRASARHRGDLARPSMTVTPSLASRLATERRPGRPVTGASTSPHQRDGPALPRRIRRPSRCRSARRRPPPPARSAATSSSACAQPLRLLQFGQRIGEFGSTRDAGGHRAGAADGVDQVVVAQRRHPELSVHAPGGGVDPRRRRRPPAATPSPSSSA